MWGLIIEAAILTGSYIYHRWFEDQPAVLRWQPMVLPRTAEGTPLPLVYGSCRVRNPVMVWSGNNITPGDAYHPFDPGVGDGGVNPQNPIADHFSVDMIFVLGIPPYSPPNTQFSAGAAFVGLWYGDSRVLNLFTDKTDGLGGQIGSELTRFYAGRLFFPGEIGQDLTPLQRDEFNIAGMFYSGDTAGKFPLDATDIQPFFIFFDRGGLGQILATYPDRVYYSTNAGAGNCSALTALTQAGDANKMGAIRNQVGVYLHVGLGQSSSISGFSFEIYATTNFTASDLGIADWRSPTGIHIDMRSECDPAAVLYDILTSSWGKLGIGTTRIDIASFQSASQTLFDEFNGYSRCIDQGTDASQIIQELLQQMDAVLYEEPSSGKLTLKLIRFDYNSALLDDVNPGNATPEGSGWYSVQSWAEVTNQVKITWTNRSLSYQDAIVTAQDSVVAINNGGRIRTASLSFPGVCTSTSATRIAARELNAISQPMVKATVKVSRAFYQHRPGDVVTFTWPDLGINKMVMRIAGVDFGQLHDPSITMQLMRDVFDVQGGAFPYNR